MQAMMNIQVLNGYGVESHRHRLSALLQHLPERMRNSVGRYEVLHHSQLLQQLINDGRLRIEGGAFSGKTGSRSILVISGRE